MALGFIIDTVSPPENIVYDRALNVQSTPRVLVAKFGDGYEQRLADGINTLEQTWNISFVNRTRQEIDDIAAYFTSLNGATAFNFTIPDSNVTGSPAGERTIKVVCENFNIVYVQTECYTCTATFRRVYEA